MSGGVKKGKLATRDEARDAEARECRDAEHDAGSPQKGSFLRAHKMSDPAGIAFIHRNSHEIDGMGQNGTQTTPHAVPGPALE